ncbi:50S ribosomal protein L15 [Candidatus Parcubacteria bacterium]|nr:50S ribosomal protein L15 [Candidatus Parcubacteria bacterium]
MQLHQLKPVHKLKNKKRVGRGGKKGTYSGRGMKGQKSRSGNNYEPIIRGMIKKYPKLKGYRFGTKSLAATVVNIGTLEKSFDNNDIVNPQTLLDKKLIDKLKGKMPKVKILANGNLTKALNIEGCQLSKTAEENITKAKGTVKKEEVKKEKPKRKIKKKN